MLVKIGNKLNPKRKKNMKYSTEQCKECINKSADQIPPGCYCWVWKLPPTAPNCSFRTVQHEGTAKNESYKK